MTWDSQAGFTEAAALTLLKCFSQLLHCFTGLLHVENPGRQRLQLPLAQSKLKPSSSVWLFAALFVSYTPVETSSCGVVAGGFSGLRVATPIDHEPQALGPSRKLKALEKTHV